MNVLIEKYSAFLNNIEASPNAKLISRLSRTELANPSPRLLAKWPKIFKEEYDVSLAEEHLVYFKFMAVTVVWEGLIPEVIPKTMFGGFKIRSVTAALTSIDHFWKGAFSLPPDVPIPEELKHFEKLAWFERQDYALDGRVGCMLKERGVFPPQIIFYNKGWYTKMELSLEQYFLNMLTMYAVKGWQFFYIDITKDIPDLDEAIADMELAVLLLPKLFPEDDWSYQIEKLKTVKASLK